MTMMESKEETINKCIEIVKSFIHSSCSDHTPFRGACISCGRHDTYELISNTDELIEELEKQLKK